MADKKDKKEGSKAYSMLPGKPIFIASMICIVIGVYQAWPGNPIAQVVASAQEIKFPAVRPHLVAPAKPSAPCEAVKPVKQDVIRLELDEVKWSEQVKIPVGYTWRINRPDCWEQYWFWSEKEPRPRSEAGTTEWFGDIPHANFKLRGTKGPVEIIIEPR